MAALAETLHLHPNLNRFEAGGRLYQRYGVQISMSLKRDMGDRGSKVAVVNESIRQGTTPAELAKILRDEIAEARSARPSYVDRNGLSTTATTRPALARCPAHGSPAPSSFIAGRIHWKDLPFRQRICRELGVTQMRDAYHHLYEWGTISVFLVLGKTEERIICVDGEPRSVRGYNSLDSR